MEKKSDIPFILNRGSTKVEKAYRFTDMIRTFQAIFWVHKVEVNISCDWYASFRDHHSSNRYIDQRATWP